MIIIIIISLMESLISRHLHTLDKNNGVIILYALYNTSQEIYNYNTCTCIKRRQVDARKRLKSL